MFRHNTPHVLLAPLLLAGCAADEEGAETFDNPDSYVYGDSYVSDLAWRYLNLEVTDTEAEGINEEVRSLSPDEMRQFTDELQLLGDADEDSDLLGDLLVEIAIEEGVSFLDLDEVDLELAVQYMSGYDPESDMVPVSYCWPWESYCYTWSPSSTTTLYGYNGSGGTTASWKDSRSTETCETGGCDHRFYVSGTHSLIDGKTTAYDNWIAAYPYGILGHHSGSATYATMGNGQAVLAGIFWVSASKIKMH